MREANTYDFSLLILLAVIWGSSFFNIKIASFSYEPITLALVRVLFAIIPLFAFRQIRKYPAVVISLLPLALGHYLNAGIETVFYKTYMQDSVIWGMFMGLFAFVIFIGLATKYAKKEVKLL